MKLSYKILLPYSVLEIYQILRISESLTHFLTLLNLKSHDFHILPKKEKKKKAPTQTPKPTPFKKHLKADLNRNSAHFLTYNSFTVTSRYIYF